MKEKVQWLMCLTVGFCLIFSSFNLPGAHAEYPTKPIRIISQFAPGGGTDILARTMAAILKKENIIKVPIIVENMPGGSGATGADYVYGKAGDPYTLLTITTQFFTNTLVGTTKSSPKDFTILCQMAYDPLLVIVRSDSEYQTIDELIEGGKKNPGKIRWGGTGQTSSSRIIALALEEKTGAKFNYIPFQSGGELTIALLGKHLDVVCNQVNECYSQLAAKQFKALAVSSAERSKYFPELPTLKERGADVMAGSYRGLAAPGGIPDEANKYLNEAFRKLDASPVWQKEYVEKFQLAREFRDGPTFTKFTHEFLMPEYTKIYKQLGLIK